MDYSDSANLSVSDLKKVLGVDAGSLFSFFKFVFFLVKISLYIFSDANNIPQNFRAIHFTSDEKFYLLLERLEISQGFFEIAGGRILGAKGGSQQARLALLPSELAEFHKATFAFPNFEDYIDADTTTNKSWMLLKYDNPVKEQYKPLMT